MVSRSSVRLLDFFLGDLRSRSIILDITPEEVIALKNAEIEELKALVAKLSSQIAYLQNQLLGSKSEKLDPNQAELFGEGVEMGKPEVLPDVREDEQEEGKSKEAKEKVRTRSFQRIYV